MGGFNKVDTVKKLELVISRVSRHSNKKVKQYYIRGQLEQRKKMDTRKEKEEDKFALDITSKAHRLRQSVNQLAHVTPTKLRFNLSLLGSCETL